MKRLRNLPNYLTCFRCRLRSLPVCLPLPSYTLYIYTLYIYTLYVHIHYIYTLYIHNIYIYIHYIYIYILRESGLVAKDVQPCRSFSSLPVEILLLVPEWTLRLGILRAKAACRTHPEYSQLQHQSFALARPHGQKALSVQKHNKSRVTGNPVGLRLRVWFSLRPQPRLVLSFSFSMVLRRIHTSFLSLLS